MKTTNIIWASEILKDLKLADKDNFLEITIKEGIINVNLTDVPILSNCKSKNDTISRRFYNRTKSLRKNQ